MRILSAIILFLLMSYSLQSSAQTKGKDITEQSAAVNFLKPPKESTVRYAHGAITGTKHAPDSTGYIGEAIVFNCPKPYKILFLYKDLPTRKAMGYDSLATLFFNKELGKDSYVDFDCYAFVYPQRDPDQQEDVHALNMDFPVVVTAYKRTRKTKWQFISTIKADKFEALSEYQFKVIYHL